MSIFSFLLAVTLSAIAHAMGYLPIVAAVWVGFQVLKGINRLGLKEALQGYFLPAACIALAVSAMGSDRVHGLTALGLAGAAVLAFYVFKPIVR